MASFHLKMVSAVYDADKPTAVNDVLFSRRQRWNLDIRAGRKFLKIRRNTAVLHPPGEECLIQRAQVRQIVRCNCCRCVLVDRRCRRGRSRCRSIGLYRWNRRRWSLSSLIVLVATNGQDGHGTNIRRQNTISGWMTNQPAGTGRHIQR